MTNFNQTSQECVFGGPLSKLFKDYNSIENFGCCGIRKGENCRILKNLLVDKYWPDLKIILHKCPWGTLYQDSSNISDPLKNMAARGAELIFLICALLNFKNLLVQKY